MLLLVLYNASRPHVSVLGRVPDIGPNGALDITSSEDLDELAKAVHSAGIALGLAEVRSPVIETARRTGLLATIGEDRCYQTIDEAVAALVAPQVA